MEVLKEPTSSSIRKRMRLNRITRKSVDNYNDNRNVIHDEMGKEIARFRFDIDSDMEIIEEPIPINRVRMRRKRRKLQDKMESDEEDDEPIPKRQRTMNAMPLILDEEDDDLGFFGLK